MVDLFLTLDIYTRLNSPNPKSIIITTSIGRTRSTNVSINWFKLVEGHVIVLAARGRAQKGCAAQNTRIIVQINPPRSKS